MLLRERFDKKVCVFFSQRHGKNLKKNRYEQKKRKKGSQFRRIIVRVHSRTLLNSYLIQNNEIAQASDGWWLPPGDLSTSCTHTHERRPAELRKNLLENPWCEKPMGEIEIFLFTFLSLFALPRNPHNTSVEIHNSFIIVNLAERRESRLTFYNLVTIHYWNNNATVRLTRAL